MNILKVKNLSKVYQSTLGETLAIDDISFNVKKGEIISIIGPSGCGKSTILSILSGITDKSSGDILCDKDVEFAYMLQDDCLLPNKRVYENCLIGLEVRGILNEESSKYVDDLIKSYGLYEFRNKYPNSLSGGMRQRVAHIRTLAVKPKILLLDEATSALDYQSRLLIEEDIYKIIKESGITTIMVTHDIGQAISMSDRIIVLTKRPAKIKNIYNIKLTNKSSPINNRKCQEFNLYFDKIWRDLSHE